MTVTVNGETRQLAPGTTVGALLDDADVAPARRGVAVAVGGEVLARGSWDTHELSDGDRVEIVAAIGGG